LDFLPPQATMTHLKKYLLAFLLLEMFFSYAPAFAQTTNTIPDYSTAGVSTQIEKYLCSPNSTYGQNTVNQNISPTNSNPLFLCINQLYKFAIVIASVVGVFFIVIAGYIYMSAEGNNESVEKAKSILTSTITAIVILLAGYVLLRALNPDLVQFQSIQPQNVTLTPNAPLTTTGGTGGGTSNTGTISTSNCSQNFTSGYPSFSTGCSGSSCVNVYSKTSHNDPTDCQTGNGQCLVSQSAANDLNNFISTFNSLAQGACSVQIASAIQSNGGPSVDPCHNPASSVAGTCVDMHLIPYNSTCQQAFYQAAQQSGVVSRMIDEYCQAVSSTTGGNIHINF